MAELSGPARAAQILGLAAASWKREGKDATGGVTQSRGHSPAFTFVPLVIEPGVHTESRGKGPRAYPAAHQSRDGTGLRFW